MLHQKAHGIDIQRIGSAPKWSRALEVDPGRAQNSERVLRVPKMFLQANVRVGSGLEQGLHEREVGGFLLLVLLRVSIGSSSRPGPFEGGKQRRRSSFAFESRIRTPCEKYQGKVELPADRCHQQRRRLIPRGWLVDVGASIQKSEAGIDVPLPNRMKKRREPSPAVHELPIR